MTLSIRICFTSLSHHWSSLFDISWSTLSSCWVDHVALSSARCARLRFDILEALKFELWTGFSDLRLVPDSVVGVNLRVRHSNRQSTLARWSFLHPNRVSLLLDAVLTLAVDVLDNIGDSFITWKGLTEGYVVTRHALAHHPVAIGAKRHHFDVMILPLSTISL